MFHGKVDRTYIVTGSLNWCCRACNMKRLAAQLIGRNQKDMHWSEFMPRPGTQTRSFQQPTSRREVVSQGLGLLLP